MAIFHNIKNLSLHKPWDERFRVATQIVESYRPLKGMIPDTSRSAFTDNLKSGKMLLYIGLHHPPIL